MKHATVASGSSPRSVRSRELESVFDADIDIDIDIDAAILRFENIRKALRLTLPESAIEMANSVIDQIENRIEDLRYANEWTRREIVSELANFTTEIAKLTASMKANVAPRVG